MGVSGYLLVLMVVVFGAHVYLRTRVLRSYKKLSRSGIRVTPFDVLSRQKVKGLAEEHPEYSADIREFTKHLRISFYLAAAVFAGALVLISILYLT